MDRSLTALLNEAHDNSRAHGWWEEDRINASTIPEKLMLIVSEASEALEDFRDGNMEARRLDYTDDDGAVHPGKPIGFPTELADIVIRVFDLAGYLGIDLEQEIIDKMAFNRTRKRHHGGKAA